MSKHTPGPWIADDAFMLDGNAVRVGTPFEGGRLYESVTICECWVRDESDEQDCEETGDSPDVLTAEANARLIAAAPDLLDNCIKALAAWEGTGPAIILDDLRAAIAKATQP